MADYAELGLSGNPLDYLSKSETPAGLHGMWRAGEPRWKIMSAADRVAKRIISEQSPDGSWESSLYQTAFHLLELSQLGRDADDVAFERGIEWMRSRLGLDQRAPKWFAHTERDEKERRARAYTHRIAHAKQRFASLMATRALLGAGLHHEQWVKEVAHEIRSEVEASPYGFLCCGNCGPAGHQVLGLMGTAFASPDLCAAILCWYRSNVKPDGSGWEEVDLFHALDAIACMGNKESHEVAALGIPALIAQQNPDGSWGTEYVPEKTLVAALALGLL